MTPHQHQYHPFPEDQSEHISPPCAQRHSHPDFVRSPRHAVSHHPVDAHRRQGQPHAREDAEQDRVELSRGDFAREEASHRLDFRDGLIFVDGLNLAHHGASQRPHVRGRRPPRIARCSRSLLSGVYILPRGTASWP